MRVLISILLFSSLLIGVKSYSQTSQSFQQKESQIDSLWRAKSYLRLGDLLENMLVDSRANHNKEEEILSLINLHEYKAFHTRNNQEGLEYLIQAIDLADLNDHASLSLLSRSKLIYFYQTTIQDQDIAQKTLDEMNAINNRMQSEFYLMVINQWDAQIVGTRRLIGLPVDNIEVNKSISILNETLKYFKPDIQEHLFYYQQARRCMVGFYPDQIGYEAGLNFLQDIKSFEPKMKDPLTSISNLIFEGSFYTYFKRYKLLIKRLNEDQHLLSEANHGLKKFYYQLLSEAYSQSGDYKNALITTIKMNEHDAKVNSVAFANKIESVRLKNESLEAKIQNSTLRTRGNYLMFIVGLILTGLILLLLAFRKVSSQSHVIQQQRDNLKEVNQMKNKLFSILAHDLRDPIVSLNNISKKVKYLAERGETDRLDEMTEDINQRTSSLESMLKNILPWMAHQVQSSDIDLEPVRLTDIIESALDESQYKIENKELNLHLKNLADYKVIANRDALTTVIRNILGNAIKYTRKKGVVDISSEKLKHKNIVLIITDDGIGMDSAHVQQVFSTFQSKAGTEGEKGLGIGLKLSKDLILSMNGDIEIQSTVGEGTSVRIRLKAA